MSPSQTGGRLGSPGERTPAPRAGARLSPAIDPEPAERPTRPRTLNPRRVVRREPRPGPADGAYRQQFNGPSTLVLGTTTRATWQFPAKAPGGSSPAFARLC